MQMMHLFIHEIFPAEIIVEQCMAAQARPPRRRLRLVFEFSDSDNVWPAGTATPEEVAAASAAVVVTMGGTTVFEGGEFALDPSKEVELVRYLR